MITKLKLYLALCAVVALAVACGTTAPPAAVVSATPQPPAATTVAAAPTQAPATAVPATQVPATQAPATEAPATAAAAPTAPTSAPSGTSFGFPPPPTGLPANLPPAQPLGSYVAFAWNTLGMHCFQQDFSMFLILPPYNVFWTQVVARGREDPSIVSSGLTATYAVPQVTDPAAHTNFWQYAAAYGFNLAPGIGLTGNGTAGTMTQSGDHFIADGVPVVDFNDDGTWDPYPYFTVAVKNSAGSTVAETLNVAPVSTEMSCYLCHPGSTIQDSMAGILQAHDKAQGTSLLSQAQGGKPVLCNSCHADPAMGVTTNQDSSTTLSGAMHTFHADKMSSSPTGAQLPANLCQACHPGPETQCLRGAMATAGVTCIDCHGTMSDVGDPARTPWVNLPACQSCHTAQLVKATVKTIANPNQHLTATEAELYRNSKAHGGGGIYCPACHGSTHAIYTSTLALDNQQSIRLQGSAGFINDCSVCHQGRPDESFFHLGRGD
jgi:hypothetical protein